MSAEDAFVRTDRPRAAGLLTGCFIPAYEHTEVVAVLEFFSRTVQAVTPQLTDLLAQVATQVGRVVARERAAARLNHEALHDALTGLAKRRLFHRQAQVALRAGQDRQHGVGVLIIDLDWFKTINDSLGHHIGDSIRREIAARLQACVRPDDTVARLGGDEFAFLLPVVAHCSDADRLGERILDALRVRFAVDDGLLTCQASIGIALTATGTETADDLLRDADIAMYAAKEAGRGQSVVFTPAMHRSARLRLELGGDLQRALAAGEFGVHYQPQYSLTTGRVIGTEALVRWRHPQRGLVLPAQFIAIAEETGLIGALGAWVLERACAQTVRWQGALRPDRPLAVAVNLSIKQFGPALTATVAAALRRSGLPAERLALEITESLLMDDDRATAQLSALKALGVRLSIDDFGTGSSSLARVRSHPPDELKIDRSFVDEITVLGQPAPMVSAVITLAHAAGATVVAEGVETATQLAFLRAAECDVVQGYLLSHPVPPDDIPALLDAPELLGVRRSVA